MPDFIVPNVGQTIKTIVLDGLGVSSILHTAASTTAMIHHMGTATSSPGGVLKAAEWYSYALNLAWPVALYRKLNYGTIDTGSFDITEMTTNQKAAAATAKTLYGQMCNNFFHFAARGPQLAKLYIDGLVAGTEGQQTAMQQHFAAIREANNEITDSIDRLRRRVYVTKVACEVAMVALGAAPIALGVQIGVGLGYSLITSCITNWSGMTQADIVAMPVKEPTVPASVSAGAGVAANVAQEVVDRKAEVMDAFEAARQRAIQQQQAAMERKIERMVERAGGRDALNRAGRKSMEREGTRWAANAERGAALKAGTQATTSGMRAGVRAGGIVVGLLFMIEDLGNVATIIREGKL